MATSKKISPGAWRRSARKLAPGTPVEVWFQDEMRVGQKNKLTYRWARKGSRLGRSMINARSQPICLARYVQNAAPAPPSCCQPATAKPCSFISMRSPPRWPTRLSSLIKPVGMVRKTYMKSNIWLLPLPPRSPELNSQENIWQFIRQNWLSNRIFQSFDDIVDHCCDAWNALIDQPWKIMSIAYRDWAVTGQSF